MSAVHFKKILAVCTAFLLIAVTAVISGRLIAKAELVNVYTTKNPTFEFERVWDSRTAKGWESSGELLENDSSSGKYKMKTNAYAFWSDYDGIDFAYVKSPFNTGSGSLLTVETTIDSWDGSGAASTGICIRNSLAGNENGIYLCVRPGIVYFMSRDVAANRVNSGPTKSFTANVYPLKLRIVLNYDKKIATGYWFVNGVWDTVGNAKFKNVAKQLYVGVASHSANQSSFYTSSWSDFSIKLDAPEGYVIDDDSSSSSSGSSEPEIVLPKDPEPLGDTLLRETFTDGNLTPSTEEMGIDNPYWDIVSGTPKLAVDDEHTDRWLQLSALDDELVMYTGDKEMTDYSVSADITFNSADVLTTEENNFTLLVRARAVPVGGCFDYGITLKNEIDSEGLLKSQKLVLQYRYGDSDYFPDYSRSKGAGHKAFVLKSVTLAEKSMVEMDVAHKLKVDVFDNTIKVYFDDMNTPIITWDDSDRANKVYDSNNLVNETSYPNLYGKIGIATKNITAKVDNIVVRDLPDALGGDYDNFTGGIGGSFDMPIPDYIKQKYKRN